MDIENIKILILAGGFGTRLRDVVSDVPKPMAPVNKKPFLLHKIEKIRKYLPKNQIYLLTHHMSDIIEEYFKGYPDKHFVKENKALGTGGSIKNAVAILGLRDDERLLVMNGDTYIEPNYIDFIENATRLIRNKAFNNTNTFVFNVYVINRAPLCNANVLLQWLRLRLL